MGTRNACYKRAALLWIAMPLFFLSCEKEMTDGGPVRIRIAVTDAPFNQNRSARAAKSETVVAELEGGNNLCLYATLTEDVTAAGAELRGFEVGAKVRIVVYDSGDNYVTEALGTASYSLFTLDGGESLDVLPGNGYTFVAYSFNDVTDPPVRPADDVLRNVASPHDLLYGKSDPVNIVAGDNAVTISMTHLFSQVRLVASATAGLSGNITAVSADLFPSYAVDLPLFNAGVATGVPSPVAASEVMQSFTFPTGLNAATVESRPLTVFTNSTNPIEVMVNSVEITGVNGDNPLLGGYIAFPFALGLGTSYTLTVSLKESSTGPWAGSNIYWDGDRLTFDVMGETDHALYQGVFFKWGSLVGVSPAEYWDTSGTNSTATVYVPTYQSGNPTASTWRSGPAGVEVGNWASIPYIIPTNTSETYLHENSTPAFYGGMKGDICRYIGETGAGPRGYRIPKRSDFEPEGPYPYTLFWDGRDGPVPSYWAIPFSVFPDYYATGYAADGTTSIYSHVFFRWPSGVNVAFPASGLRLYASYGGGTWPPDRGVWSSEGFYWTTSAYDLNVALRKALYFQSSYVSLYDGWTDYGFPIRCIKT
jgi:hypothetical protein